MTNAAQETKIELVTEAIEALVLATVAAHTISTSQANAINRQNVLDARRVVHDAFKHLLQPVLRVTSTERHDQVGDISTTKRKVVSELTPYRGEGIDGMPCSKAES
jgi:hypothetical protein